MPILICYDGSHRAARAISLARGTLAVDQAILLHVWNPPAALLADSVGDPGAPGPSMEELEQFALDRAQTIAREGHELARAEGLGSRSVSSATRQASGGRSSTLRRRSMPRSSWSARAAAPPYCQGSWVASRSPSCTTRSGRCSSCHTRPVSRSLCDGRDVGVATPRGGARRRGAPGAPNDASLFVWRHEFMLERVAHELGAGAEPQLLRDACAVSAWRA